MTEKEANDRANRQQVEQCRQDMRERILAALQRLSKFRHYQQGPTHGPPTGPAQWPTSISDLATDLAYELVNGDKHG